MKRILFVDDEPKVLDGLRRMLYPYRNDWHMVFVSSAAEALKHLAQSPFDVLVTDVRMPQMSGIELLEEMRRRGETLPAILITGRLDATLGERACAAGALAVVEKPYVAAEILNLVREALGQTKTPPV